MRYRERWMGFHLFVIVLVELAMLTALVVDGLGLAVIVGALAVGIVLAVGYPLLVMRAEGKVRPTGRRRP
jgi:hypothetical protein